MRLVALLAISVLAGCGEEEGTSDKILVEDDALLSEAVRGRDSIYENGCGTCHVIPGIKGADGLTGPPLTAMSRQVYVAGVAPNTPEMLAAFIMDPQAVDPRSAMPDLAIGAEDAAAIAAYLYSAGEGG